MAKDKVIVYIDASNLYLRSKSECGTGKIKLREFCHNLTTPKRVLHKVKYFCVNPPPPNKNDFNMNSKTGLQKYLDANTAFGAQMRWMLALERWKPISLIRGNLIKNHGKGAKYSEKGVDVALAIHMVADVIRPTHEVSIIVSGDSDLVMAVEVAKGQSIRVEGAAFQPCYHISQACDSFTMLDKTNMAPYLKF